MDGGAWGGYSPRSLKDSDMSEQLHLTSWFLEFILFLIPSGDFLILSFPSSFHCCPILL